MAHHTSDNSFKILRNKLIKQVFDNLKDYLDSFFIDDFINNYLTINNLEIKKLIIDSELLGLDIKGSTIRKYLGKKDTSLPSLKTLRCLAILLKLDNYNRIAMVLSFCNSVFDAQFRENNEFFYSIINDVIKNNFDDILKTIIVSMPNITKNNLADFFDVNYKTIERHFIKLGINNIGSRKKPYWVIKGKNK